MSDKPQDETVEYWFSQHCELDRIRAIQLLLVKMHRNSRAKYILAACLAGLEMKTLRDAFTQMEAPRVNNNS